MAEHNITVRQNLSTGLQDDGIENITSSSKLCERIAEVLEASTPKPLSSELDVSGLGDEYVAGEVSKFLAPCIITGDTHVPTTETQAKFLSEIIAEREYQDGIYGNAAERAMTEDLWLKIIRDYTNGYGRAANYDFETRMKKGAAICLAAREWYAAGGRDARPAFENGELDQPFLHQG